MTGTVRAIWIKRAHRGSMDSVDHASFISGKGIAGSADRSRRRQVTIIDESAWNRALAELGATVPASARRANLMVAGLDLANSRGRTLLVGNVRLVIGGETRPCERMEEARAGLQGALDPEWRAGVFAQVLDDGDVRVGDDVRWADAA